MSDGQGIGRRGNIVACIDIVNGEEHEPQTLRTLGPDRLLGRVVSDWSSSLGSYGMGGPGFFGLLLRDNGEYPDEWLTLRLWGAANWLLLNGHWLESHPNQYHVQKPLYSNYGGDESWDHVSGLLPGSAIVAVRFDPDRSLITLANRAERHTLEIPADPIRLPLYGGTGQPHAWNPTEDQRDAWIMSHGDLRI